MAVSSVGARAGRFLLSGASTGKCRAFTQSTSRLFVGDGVLRRQLCVGLSTEQRSSALFLSSVRADSTTTEARTLPANQDTEFRDRYIPMTRKTLIQNLLQEPIFLTEEEKKSFEAFSLALDVAIRNRHKGILTELKTLFDPINPDKDTIESRSLNRRDRLDHEFWLLQKLAMVMEKANFHELPKTIVEDSLKEHNIGGIQVSINIEKYDVVRFWVLGQTAVRPQCNSWYQAILKKLKAGLAVDSPQYYKRVVIATRLKRDDRLFLKAYKEVPVDRLDQLLPAGSLKMTIFDQRLLMLYGALGLGGLLGKVLAKLFQVHANWTLVLTAMSAAAATQLWTSFKNKQQRHLVELSTTLYFKNIINNRGLLTLLLDKAEDEIFKEVLLTYAFLLVSRPPSVQEKPSEEQTSAELGLLPSSLLQAKVSDWFHFKTGSHVQFDPSEGIQLLSDLGILHKDADDILHVLPLKIALRNLPQANSSLSSRIEEYDLIEGFEVERSILEETEAEYSLAAKLRRAVGWF